MSEPLANLSGPGKSLTVEPPDANEIAGLLRTGMARLNDACNASLALERRCDLAYNAAHPLCLAALRRKGYRPSNRYIVFQAVPHTLGLGPEVWRVLDKCHSVRNRGEYEGLMVCVGSAKNPVNRAMDQLVPMSGFRGSARSRPSNARTASNVRLSLLRIQPFSDISPAK